MHQSQEEYTIEGVDVRQLLDALPGNNPNGHDRNDTRRCSIGPQSWLRR